VTIKFLVCRLINAAAISISIIGLALYFGAEGWTSVVLIQTISVFLPFMSFGYNEGFGVRLPLREQLSTKLVALFVINVLLAIVLLIALLTVSLIYSFSADYFILPLALAAILTFSLMRIYLRGLGKLVQLSWLYLINATLVFGSAFGAVLMQEPLWFLIFFHVSQLISCIFVILLVDKSIFSGVRKSLHGLWRFIFVMSRRGLPIMYAGLLFEVVMNADRLYIILASNKGALSLVGVALTISKGSFMILSVINTSHYKTMANLIRKRNRVILARNLRNQIFWGFMASFVALCFSFTVTNSRFFFEMYPSYSGVATYILWQGLYISLFAVIVPLSTFCNLYYGGKVYFTAMLSISIVSVIFAVITASIDLSIWTFYAASCLGLALVAGNLFFRVKRELVKWN
jgi:O-antigen/teichoic acid export membrane protein